VEQRAWLGIGCAAITFMANYIPWYGKKKARLAEVEHAFIAILKNATAAKKLNEVAEKVRRAHVRTLKARRALLPPTEKASVAIEGINREIQFWMMLKADQIIAGYSDGSLPKHQRL
jgi:hypothetical protein